MGKEKGLAFWRNSQDFEAIFVEENGKIHFDFNAYVIYRLQRAGIPTIDSVGLDTYTDLNYNSYRRDSKNPARQLSIIEIKEA